MLGPIGPMISNFLASKGYQIYRPTHLEHSLMRSFFEDWFSKDIDLFAKLYAANRAVLGDISQWARPADLAPSLWRYGVPEQWDAGAKGLGQTGLNEVEKEPTYSDLIAFICSGLPDLRYLEIGVSVGKNFLQIARNVPGRFVGLDVERINPVLSEALGGGFAEHKLGTTQTVDTLDGPTAPVELAVYRSGDVDYLRGDQFSPDTWAALRGRSFNFIFSDGVHTPEALIAELDFLIAENLIDKSGDFAMYWDDLVNIEMQTAFDECAKRLKKIFGRGRHSLHWIHGTYGSKRLNGVFVA